MSGIINYRQMAVDWIVKLCILFFSFPLISPAIDNIVIYPYIFLGAYFFSLFYFSNLQWFFIACSSIVMVCCAAFDLIAVLRFISFILSCFFVVGVLGINRYRDFFYKIMIIHALIIISQFALVIFGVNIDFSIIFKSLYGDLLPSVGSHIDYNAFSQFGLYLPRVAGLNREPAYASILFLSVAYLLFLERKMIAASIMMVAVLVSLSKIVIVILPVLFIIYLCRNEKKGNGVVINVLSFCGVQIFIFSIIGLSYNYLIEVAQLDASFYHRFIGSLMVYRYPEQFSLFGESWSSMIKMPELSDYEFLLNQRAFFDGSVIPKFIVDYGWIPLFLFVFCVALVSRRWFNSAAIAMAGIFLNLISVSPATVLLFVVLCGKSHLGVSISGGKSE